MRDKNKNKSAVDETHTLSFNGTTGITFALIGIFFFIMTYMTNSLFYSGLGLLSVGVSCYFIALNMKENQRIKTEKIIKGKE